MEKIINLSRELICIPSLSHDTEQLHICIDTIAEKFSQYPDAIVEKKIYEWKPSLLIANFEWQRADIVLNGHIDVVDVQEPKQFIPYIEDGKLYGRGAGDMKSGVALMIELMREIFEKEFITKKVLLMLTADEEVWGMHGVKMLVNEWRGGDVVLIPDGWSTYTINSVEKWMFTFEIESIGKSCHSSRPWQWKNALHQIVDFFRAIKKQLEDTKEVYSSDEHWWTSVNLNMISGGDVANQIPEYARAKFDIRFIENINLLKIKEIVSSTLQKYHCNIVSERSGEVHYEDVFHPFFKKYRDIAEKILWQELSLVKSHGTSDGRFFAEIGRSVVLLHRPDCKNLHGRDEWVDITSLGKIYQCYHAMIFEKKEERTKS